MRLKTCRFRKRDSSVPMMQPAMGWMCNHISEPLDRPCVGRMAGRHSPQCPMLSQLTSQPDRMILTGWKIASPKVPTTFATSPAMLLGITVFLFGLLCNKRRDRHRPNRSYLDRLFLAPMSSIPTSIPTVHHSYASFAECSRH